MNETLAVPPFSSTWTNQAILLEAPPGPGRQVILDRWLRDASRSGATTWSLSCAFEEGGVWAGLATLLDALLPRVRARAPHLIDQHAYELTLILPWLREQLVVRNPNLTDSASEEEKVRNYPADRAYRSLHGVIDFLTAWHDLTKEGAWVIACDDYDRANDLVHRFFSELLRRRGERLGLTLLLAAETGRGDASIRRIPSQLLGPTFRVNAAAEPSPAQTLDWAARAREIEDELNRVPALRETLLPALIHARERSGGSEDDILRLKVEAMRRCIHRGTYEAALAYAPAVEQKLADLHATDPKLHDVAVNSLFFAYVPLGHAEAAYRVVKQEMLERAGDPTYLPRIYYLLAMLHARFLPGHDLSQAEAYLNRALDVLESLPADALPPEQRAFLTVFTKNGLALVRVRQRRPGDAVALCREGIQILDEQLPPDKHRLHRSVLVYNIAQVYAQIGPAEEAIAQFSAVMTLDPNYSEYFNERGTILFRVGRLEEAVADYRRAIELSPPYPEVWTNLGQCFRAMGALPEALDAYSRALDLDPGVTLARVGRADTCSDLGDFEAALDDYTRALNVVADDPAVLAGRAIALYELGRILESLADLDRAIALAPTEADYYLNRSTALTRLGRREEAVLDLRTYLQLAPDAEDWKAVVARLVELRGQESGVNLASLTAERAARVAAEG